MQSHSEVPGAGISRTRIPGKQDSARNSSCKSEVFLDFQDCCIKRESESDVNPSQQSVTPKPTGPFVQTLKHKQSRG